MEVMTNLRHDHKMGEKLPTHHPGIAWLMPRVAWLYSQFVVGDDVWTVFSRQVFDVLASAGRVQAPFGLMP